MLRLILTIVPILAIAACSQAPVVGVTADPAALCTALAPNYPLPIVSYDTTRDTPATVGIAKNNNLKYREANARYQAACQ